MARVHPAGQDRAAVLPDDLSALATMAQIAELASSDLASPNSTSVPATTTAPCEPARVAGAQLHNARLLLSEQNSLGKTRMRFAKRLVLRGSRLFTHRLVGAGQDLADAIEIVEVSHGQAIADLSKQPDQQPPPFAAGLDERISRLEMDHSRLDNTLHAQLTSVELGVDDALAAIARASAALNENARGLDVRLSALERSSDHDRSELHRTRTLVQRLVRTVAQHGGTAVASVLADSGSTPDTAVAFGQSTAGVPAALDDATYVDFEHRFRGSRDEIRARQKDAVPFVAGLAGSLAPVLDLGCGRGEWLELLQEMKVPGYGVDSNSAMVAEALRSGLDARLGDAIEHLDQLEESSLQGVSAFHFVEHIPIDALVRLLDSTLLALRPGGLLLLETPNPTNLIVGAASFYLDPTHLRVLHPDFLSFLVESRGFVDVQVHYVHPVIDEEGLDDGQSALQADARLSRVVRNVEWALFGPQDYLLSARRAEVAP